MELTTLLFEQPKYAAQQKYYKNSTQVIVQLFICHKICKWHMLFSWKSKTNRNSKNRNCNRSLESVTTIQTQTTTEITFTRGRTAKPDVQV